jgi:hypothetical protein
MTMNSIWGLWFESQVIGNALLQSEYEFETKVKLLIHMMIIICFNC